VAINILDETGETAMSERGKFNALTMASSKMTVTRGYHLGGLVAHVVGNSNDNHGHNLTICPRGPMQLWLEWLTIVHRGSISMIPHHLIIYIPIA
jgi:hypothetical protein